MMAVLFAICVCILAIGFVWFWIARPILEDCGLIRDGEIVNTSQVAPAPDLRVMSRPEDAAFLDRPLSLQTDSRQTADKPVSPAPSRDVMLNTFKLLRKYSIPREEARPIIKALGLPLDNNLWADAAPEEPPHVTPIAARPTSARFDATDPDYPYRAPA